MKKDFEYTGTENLEAMSHAKNYNKVLIDEVKKYATSKSKILDLGAGTGTYARLLKSEGFTNIICVEPDSKLQNRLRKDGFKVYGDIEDIKDVSIDFVYSFNVLEHIKNDVFVVKQLKNKLKSGSYFLGYVPAFMILYSSMDKRVGHYRRYTTKNVNEILLKSKLKIVYSKYADPIGFFAALVFRFVGSKNGEISTKSIIFYDKYAFPLSRVMSKITGRFFGKNVLFLAKK